MTDRKQRLERILNYLDRWCENEALSDMSWLVSEYQAIERDCEELIYICKEYGENHKDQWARVELGTLRKIAAHFIDAPEWTCPYCGSEAKESLSGSKRVYLLCLNDECECNSPYAATHAEAHELWHNPRGKK